MSVLDASFLTDALVAGGRLGDATQSRLLRVDRLHAPHLIGVEVLSAVRGLLARGAISEPVARGALDRVAMLRMSLHAFGPFQHRVWELRDNATPYDAWYLALAEAVDEPLITTDAKLATVPGVRCEVEVVIP